VKLGEEVYGQATVFYGGSGSLAEFASAPSDKMAVKPKSLSMAEAASLPLVGASAIQAIEAKITWR
jgi:NADPH:quinone reductase-like Zn-dependent oxidoreductase